MKKRTLKKIDGYKKCLECGFVFPFRKSLNVRSLGIIRKQGIGSTKTKFCSRLCFLQWHNRQPDIRLKVKERMKGNSHSTGFKQPLELREIKRINNLGDKSHFWQGGKTEENKIIRISLKYRLWRDSVFERDSWTCQKCKTKGGKLHAHHINSFSKFPELRFDASNGITLCEDCHKKTETYLKK